ncbi:MAG: TolB family protein, partial [Dehalococcoidia bacterium]
MSPPVGLNVIDKGGTRYLRVRFPDTDALVGATSDDRTLTGPVTVAVTTTVVPLPCSLASSTCAETSGLLACIDELFESDGSCAAVAHGVFPHFTALPPPNDYQSVCTTPSSPCTGTATEVRMTVDTDGNLLIPVDWRGILVRKAEVPVPRLLRAASSVDAFSGITAPIRIPNGAFVDSYTPEGGLLPPIFDPQTDPSATNELVLFGSADAPETVLRLARRSPNFRECSGGVRDALPCVQDSDCESGSCVATTCNGGVNRHLACTADADCPGGECGRGLFELRDRLSDGGVGPILVPHEASVAPSAPVRRGVCDGGSGVGQVCPPANCGTSLCVDYRIEAEFPVPLDGISTTDELHSFVVDEAIEAVDLNGDGDTSDRVVTVVDRDTGETLPTGLAATRLRTPPFGFPALAVEGAVVAFLEPDEVALGCTSPPACDANGDGDVRDTFLRVFRQEAGGLTELLASGQLAAEAVPEIDGKAVAVSQGLVFARMSEADAARQKTERVSVGSNGTEGNKGSDAARLSADGRFVAFQSDATNLVLGDTNAAPDVFVRDRQLGTTERVSVDSTGAQGVGTAGISGSYAPSISADGRFVAFWSDATNLVPGDTNGAADVFVHDRLTGTTERVSTDSGGLEANASSGLPSISSDGRFVAFLSFATNVVAGDTNAVLDAFVHDRLTGT